MQFRSAAVPAVVFLAGAGMVLCSLFLAFNVPGKFGLEIASLEVVIPNVVRVLGNGIRINYDPNWDREANGPHGR